jgi:hypothetical protein
LRPNVKTRPTGRNGDCPSFGLDHGAGVPPRSPGLRPNFQVQHLLCPACGLTLAEVLESWSAWEVWRERNPGNNGPNGFGFAPGDDGPGGSGNWNNQQDPDNSGNGNEGDDTTACWC